MAIRTEIRNEAVLNDMSNDRNDAAVSAEIRPLLGDWRIVARETQDPSGPLINFFLRLLLLVPEPPQHSSVTWTVRHDVTGELRKITAQSESEFAARLAAGIFD